MKKAFNFCPQDFKFVTFEGKSYAVLLVPYAAINYPSNCAAIDGYYFVVNDIYHRSDDIVAMLSSLGYTAVPNRDINLKRLLTECGLADVGMNTLCMTEQYGTRFFIAAFELQGKYNFEVRKRPSLCDGCGACAKACPTGAISADGFIRGNCLRQQMEDKHFTESGGRAAGNRLFGCDICQRACKRNAAADMGIASAELVEHTNIERLQNDIRMGNLDWIKEQIGANYATKSRLTYLIENVVKNHIGRK